MEQIHDRAQERRIAVNRRYVGGAIAAGAALAAGVFWLTRPPAADDPKARANVATSFRFAYPRGERLDYTFEVTSVQHAAAPESARQGGAPSAIDAKVRLRGALELRGYGHTDEGWRVGIVLHRLDDHQLEVLGADALGTETLVDREVIVAYGDRGEVRTIATRRDASDGFRSLAHLLVQALAVTAPATPEAQWTADERSPFGLAKSSYRTVDGANRWSRARSYSLLAALGAAPAADARVETTADVRVADGHVERLEANEHVVQSAPELDVKLDASLDLSGKGSFDVAAGLATDADLETRTPGDPISADRMRQKSFAQMAGSTKLSDIETRIRALSAGVEVEEGFMTRAVAYLALHPEQYAALREVCEEPGANARSRAYVLDLLRSVDTKEAQGAMRDVLSSAVVRRDVRGYPALVERLALVRTPDLETVKFAQTTFDSSNDPLVRRAALVALGSAAGTRQKTNGDAKAFVERVGAELARAKTEIDKQAAIAALGNAGTPDVPARLAPYSKDPSATLRGEVATALRTVHTKEARDVLVELVADRDTSVTRATLRSLEQHTLDKADLGRVADAVTASSFGTAADEQLLTLVSKQSADRETAERILRAVAARNAGSPKVRARAEMLLAAAQR